MEPVDVAAGVDRDRVRTEPLGEPLVEQIRAQRLRLGAQPRVAADEVDTLGTEGERKGDRVKRDRGALAAIRTGAPGRSSSCGPTFR